MMFYRHIWRVLEEVFATEPEALERLHELLGEIMVDELGHIGERRSFLGHTGVTLARRVLPMMMRRFFADIPEAEVILDVNQMVQEALVFDYSGIDVAITERAWIPAYCQA
jgi:DNA-binding transcriptional LysR family regulator